MANESQPMEIDEIIKTLRLPPEFTGKARELLQIASIRRPFGADTLGHAAICVQLAGDELEMPLGNVISETSAFILHVHQFALETLGIALDTLS